MARKKARAAISQRPFVMVYQDFLESDVLGNCYQKIIYIYLKMFADADGKCFPSIRQLSRLTRISVNKVKSTLSELVHMGLIDKEHQKREDGGNGNNLYTLYDSSETWGAKGRTDGKRPFIKVYRDFLENSSLDNCYQKLVYIYLGKFADASQKCFPSVKSLAKAAGICVSKVKSTLNELKKKGMIDKKNRWRKDRGKSSNLYTLLYNLNGKLNKDNSKEENAGMINQKVMEKKKLESAPANKQIQAQTKKSIDYIKPNPRNCQWVERYSLDWIHKHFNYEILLEQNPDSEREIDSVMDILYDTLNTTQPTIMVNGDPKPVQLVVSKLKRMEYWVIMYAIKQFNDQDERLVTHPKAYMRSILYNAATGGHELGINNQAKYDMAHWFENPKNPNRIK